VILKEAERGEGSAVYCGSVAFIEYLKTNSVKANDAAVSGEPKITIPCRQNREHRIVGQAVVSCIRTETVLAPLQMQRQTRAQAKKSIAFVFLRADGKLRYRG
jgi:hypothetical protein